LQSAAARSPHRLDALSDQTRILNIGAWLQQPTFAAVSYPLGLDVRLVGVAPWLYIAEHWIGIAREYLDSSFQNAV